MSRIKSIGIIMIGFMLFSGSMMFLFQFESPTVIVEASPDFIKVKDGYISYLDAKGYNFQFACEINQILILESQITIQENQITVVSNNSFGVTELIFNQSANGNVKFSINHQGNFQRDYWFRMHIYNRGLTHLAGQNILLWETGNFDYSDMITDSFWIDQNDKGDYWLSLRFLDQVDFYIDPILSSEIILDTTSLSVFDENYLLGVENDPTDSDSLELAIRYNEYAPDNEPDLVDTGRHNYTDVFETWYPAPYGRDSRILYESYNTEANNSIQLAEEGFTRITHANLLSTAGGDDNFNNTHTIAYWIHPYTADVGGEGWYGTAGSRNFAKWNYFYTRIFQTGSDISLDYRVFGLGILNSSVIGDGCWTHVVFKQAGSKMYIYLNGSLDVSYDFGGSASYTGTSYLYVGGYSSGANTYTWYDDHFFWSKNLSDSSIANLYSNAPDYAYNQTASSTVSGNWTGFVTNGTAQAQYNLNYTIANATGIHEESLEVMDWSMHNHTIYYYHNYTFVNVTFGNGTFKTVESGFSISAENSTHDRIDFTETVAGTFAWYFLTGNAITNLIINPDETNGTLNNVTSVDYNIKVANGSDIVPSSPVKIEVMDFDGTILNSDQKSTNAIGWLNSSTDSIQFPHSSNNTYWVRVISLNESFLGVMVKRFYAYNDWLAPVVGNIVFEDTLIEQVSFSVDVSVSDDYTEFADLTITMDYGFVSSGTLTESSSLTVSGQVYTVSLVGQDAGTTLWFQIIALDNMSNSFESIVYQTDWIIEEEGIPAGGDGDGDGGAPAVAGQPTGGIPDVVLIMLFGAGAVSVAVVGYAVLQRVQVRTRRVETREVVTGLGTFGRSKEEIKVKGRKPKAKKKARAKRKQK